MNIDQSSQVLLINRKTGTQLLTKIKTAQQAIRLATQLAFDSWMDATNASGNWPDNQSDPSFENWYQTLNDSKTDLQAKFDVAQRVYQYYNFNLKLK